MKSNANTWSGYTVPLDWEPEMGHIILTPSTLPNKTEAGLIVPDSMTRKNNSGVCVRISSHGLDEGYSRFLGKECFFPLNDEYQVNDSDTGTLYYIIRADHIILTRTPPKQTKFLRVSREEGEDAA